jgi:glycine oxidase
VNPDSIVIGAGVIGCAVAYELARRGASVELVDERPAGDGATQASAGILAPYIEANEGSPLLPLSVRSLELFDEFIGRVTADSGLDVAYRRTGTLDVAVDPAELNRLQRTAEVLAARSISAELLGPEAVRGEEPHLAEDAIGGLLITMHGFVGARDLTRALATAAARRGAQMVDRCRVRRIDTMSDEVIVETDRGTRRAHAVVLAAGCWSGTIDINGVPRRVPVRPVRGQLLQLAWQRAVLRRVIWGGRCYLVPWEDGTVLVGATVEEVGFDERATVAGVRDLLDAACDLVPRIWTAAFRGARVGLRPASSDGLPIIGASGRDAKVIYATGHYRNGVLLAPLTAKLVADVMLDERIDALLETVSPARFGL